MSLLDIKFQFPHLMQRIAEEEEALTKKQISTSPQFEYIIDEKQIGIEHPVRVFNLEGLGFTKNEASEFIFLFADDQGMAPDSYTMKIKQVSFLSSAFPKEKERLKNFLKCYYASEIDLSEVRDLMDELSKDPEKIAEFNCISPTRDRSISRFVLSRNSNENWSIAEENIENFYQKVSDSDYRSKPRKFNRTSSYKTSSYLFRKFIRAVADMVEEIEGRENLESIKMTLHEVRVFAPGLPAPEGAHQDGVPYVITACVIERESIEGAKSIVFNGLPSSENTCLEIILKPGMICFHSDQGSPIWHDITGINPVPDVPTSKLSDKRPSRKTLGLDIEIKRKTVSF